MYATQNNFYVNSLNQKEQYQFSEQQIQIHRCPDSIRRSLKLNKHKNNLIANILHNKADKASMNKTTQIQNLNINIKALLNGYEDPNIIINNKINTTKNEDFQNTTDRMSNLRRRLSPVKYRQNHKNSISFDVDNKQLQKHSFLSIQKLRLIKIYSHTQKHIDALKIEKEQMNELKEKLQKFKDYNKSYINDDEISRMIITWKRNLKEQNNIKFPTNVYKIRRKQFVAPFQRYYYRDFIWKIAFSNRLYLNPLPNDMRLKVYVGKGNNSMLIKSFLNRRNWWAFTQKWQQANFIWTQLKINQCFSMQQSCSHIYKQQRQSIQKNIVQKNQSNLKIMNENDVILWDNYWSKYKVIEEHTMQNLIKRKNYLKRQNMAIINYKNVKIHNHMPHNYIIGNKKALLYTMTQYYQANHQKVFNYLPLSFHVKKGLDDDQYNKFLKRYYQRRKQAKASGFNNVWIVKPGENTNRGNGINVCLNLEQVKNIIKKGGKHMDGTMKTFILQQYIQKPFLYYRRKFDIRHYILATVVNGTYKGYWFKRGYIRTSSTQYTLNHNQASVHLTNDAVQKLLPQYGKYQKGNKLSYEQFQLYLKRQHNKKYDFFGQVYPIMKKIATDTLRASLKGMDPLAKQNNFEIFGLDFMIDSKFRPWLIQVNSNPCLQLSCPLLADIIPSMVENSLKICLDSIVCPPTDFQQKRPRFSNNCLLDNQFQLVYDSILQVPSKETSKITSNFNLQEFQKDEDECFDNQGQDYDD